ncbi:inositol monophosphatase family protein [Bermanella sp. R86510]|uniref:inositol monophosphatase family protein n=1 Tax=unclassified Bermanella TaxID=2627862 RepID=UPI0037C7B9D8
MQPIVNLALRVLREAGEELVHAVERFDFERASDQEISKFLADCAIGTEKQVIFKLRKHYPNDSFQGRETGRKDPETPTGSVWLINPIEGQDNFRSGLPLFSLVLACQMNGRTEHALVINPITGQEFTATRGRGTEMNGRRMRTSETTKLNSAILGIKYPGIAQNEQNDRLRVRLGNLARETRMIRSLGDDALTLAHVAAGHLDAAWLSKVDSTTLEAGALIAKEAGCLLTDFSGGAHYQAGDVIAANPKLIKNIIKGSL